MSQDLLLANDWDLLIQGGDFVIGNSDIQHAALIIETAPGHWKENPFLGFNAGIYLGSNTNPAEITLNLQEQLKSDNTILKQILVQGGEIISINIERLVD